MKNIKETHALYNLLEDRILFVSFEKSELEEECLKLKKEMLEKWNKPQSKKKKSPQRLYTTEDVSYTYMVTTLEDAVDRIKDDVASFYHSDDPGM